MRDQSTQRFDQKNSIQPQRNDKKQCKKLFQMPQAVNMKPIVDSLGSNAVDGHFNVSDSRRIAADSHGQPACNKQKLGSQARRKQHGKLHTVNVPSNVVGAACPDC